LAPRSGAFPHPIGARYLADQVKAELQVAGGQIVPAPDANFDCFRSELSREFEIVKIIHLIGITRVP
jgi:hypothetical protein